MRKFLILLLLVVGIGAAVIVIQTVQGRLERQRQDACMRDYRLSQADFSRWRIGGVAFRAMRGELVSAFGQPDSTWVLNGSTFWKYPNMMFAISADSQRATLYSAHFDQGAPSIALADGSSLDESTTAAEVRQRFPGSWECRNVPFGPAMWSEGYYDTNVVVADSTHEDAQGQWFTREIMLRDRRVVAIEP